MGLGLAMPRRKPAPGNGVPLPDLTLQFDASIAQAVGVPLQRTGNVEIDWGDGTTPDVVSTNGWHEHTYAGTEVYTVTIRALTGNITQLWHSVTPTGQYDALTRVVSWGDQPLTRIWLHSASNLVYVPNWLPPTVTSLNEAFKLCITFNHPNISDWNTSGVVNYTECFKDNQALNQPLRWNGTKGNNYQRMIGGCLVFDQRIDFIGGDGTVTNIDVADFANGAPVWTGDGAEVWAWQKITGCANWALNAAKLSVDLSGVTPSICTNASNAWAFAGTTASTKPKVPLDWPELVTASGMFKASGITQNLGGFRAPKATNMNAMMQTTPNNTSNLSLWPVPLIGSEPSLFSDNSGITAQPVWGTSPAADTTDPTITSSASVSVAENAALAHSLTADETLYAWRIAGGADAAEFEISGTTLRWAGNGTKDFELPDDDNANNAYLVTVEAEDISGNTAQQTITVTVTDVVEGGGPVVEGRQTSVSAASNLLSFTPTLPGSIAVGELILVAVLFDANSNPTLSVNVGASGSNWTKLGQDTAAGLVGMAIFYKIAEGSDVLQVDSTGSEQYSAIAWRISGGTTVSGTFANVTTAATNPNPPSHDAGSSAATLWIAIAAIDADNSIPSAAPAGYSNLTTRAASSATGGTMGSAEKDVVSQTEDPGAFTSSPAQEYVVATLAVRA